MITSKLTLLAIMSLIVGSIGSIDTDGDNYDYIAADNLPTNFGKIKNISQRSKARKNSNPNWLYCGDTEWCYTTRQDCNLNEDGSGYCTCKSGYKDNGNFCHDDLDECTEVIPHPCFSGPGGGCVDKTPSDGRYECLCDVGYVGMNFGDNGPTTCIKEDSCY